MKIIIVGAGISGLTTYLFLKKLLPSALPHDVQIEITIYEKHQAGAEKCPTSGSATVGGALGIVPNGLHVLRDLNEELFEKIVAKGYSCSHFCMRNSYGHTLANFPTVDHGPPQMYTVMIGRQDFWQCLREAVPDEAIVHANVLEVTCEQDQQARLKFADGSPDVKADLIIGADGVRSIVKKAVTGDGKTDHYPPTYEGLVGIGGFISASTLGSSYPPGQTTMTFGAHGFFGYGPCNLAPQVNGTDETTPTNRADQIPNPETPLHEAIWWSTYQIDTPPSTTNPDLSAIKAQLQSRHSNWKDPIIKKIISTATVDSIYPTWTSPPLPTWSNGNIVLVGDAAHALQPSSGQGASQALEDAQVLSMLLAHFLHQSQTPSPSPSPSQSSPSPPSPSPPSPSSIPLPPSQQAISLALKKYYEIRAPRITAIQQRSKQMGDMKRKKGFIEEWMTYFFLWMMGKWGGVGGYERMLKELPGEEVRRFVERDRKRERFMEGEWKSGRVGEGWRREGGK